jgi:hypothetical protein
VLREEGDSLELECVPRALRICTPEGTRGESE